MNGDFAMMLIGAVISLVGSIAVTYYFYGKATADLKAEAAKLRKLHELTLAAFFNRDAKIEPVLGPDGTIDGIIVSSVGGGQKKKK